MTMTMLSEDALSGDVHTRVRAELATRTGVPVAELTDDASLSDIGLDSLALIEVLMTLREQFLADRGLSIDDVDDPDVLPWLETVGELISFAATFDPCPDTMAPEG